MTKSVKKLQRCMAGFGKRQGGEPACNKPYKLAGTGSHWRTVPGGTTSSRLFSGKF